MEEIKSVTLHYISGRQIEVGIEAAKAALNREEWNEGKPTDKVFFERLNPFLRISRKGEQYIFETPTGNKVFNNIEDLKKDTYHNSLFEVYSKP